MLIYYQVVIRGPQDRVSSALRETLERELAGLSDADMLSAVRAWKAQADPSGGGSCYFPKQGSRLNGNRSEFRSCYFPKQGSRLGLDFSGTRKHVTWSVLRALEAGHSALTMSHRGGWSCPRLAGTRKHMTRSVFRALEAGHSA